MATCLSSGTDKAVVTSDLQRSRRSVGAVFLLHGLIFVTWVCRIPAAQQDLRLSPGQLGLVLLSASAGSLVAMPTAGWLVARYGSRRLTQLSSLAFAAALLPLPLASNPLLLSAALFVFGAAGGTQNVAMNAHAVTVEKGMRRPVMASFHALFSCGAMAGAAAGAWIASQGVEPLIHMWGSAALYSLAVLAVLPGLHDPDLQPVPSAGLTLRIPRAIAALGLLAFCVLVGEGAMADWSAVYLSSVIGLDAGGAALGYAAFSAAMVVGRFSGDRVTASFGRARPVRAGALLAAAGLAAALASDIFLLILAGFALAGLGLSIIVPNVFGAAGRAPGVPSGVGLAAVTTAGYVGFLSGPPIIGGLAQMIGLRAALGIVVLSLVTGAALAGSVEPAKGAEQE